MAPDSKRNKPFSPFLDDETGAIYNFAKTEKKFRKLPVKPITTIGVGSTGTVDLMQSTRRSTAYFAAKNFVFNSTDDRQNQSMRRRFMRETAILQSVDHKNIVKLYLSALGPKRGVILIKYCDKGSLHVEDLSNEQVLKYFINILDAVRHMHSRRIVHRDVKLDNILVQDDDVFLTDFGYSEKLPEDSNLVSGRVGTRDYSAPEVYHASCTSAYDGLKADAYSMGVVLFSLLFRKDPPKQNRGLFNLWSVLQASKNFDSMDKTLRDCARQLLEVDPHQRADVTSLYHKLGRCGYVTGYVDDGMDMDCF